MSTSAEKIAKYGFWTTLVTTIGSIMVKLMDILFPVRVEKAMMVASLDITESATMAAPDLFRPEMFILMSILALGWFSIMRWWLKRIKRS